MFKNTIAAVTLFLLVAGCSNGSKGQRIVGGSSGNINTLSVVVSNQMWEGAVGDAIRQILATPVYGLPQDEPMFSMKQMPPQVFTDFATKNRTVLKIEENDSASTRFLKDAFARPQKLVLVTGKNGTEIIEQLQKNADQIVSAFKEEELKEQLRRISLGLHKDNNIEEKLGLTMKFPSAYRVAKQDDGFYWIRKDIQTGTMNLMLYELPLETLALDESAITDIIAIRDSIGERYIPGPVDGSYMVTETAYTPFISKTIIDNKPTLETRSTWEVKNAFMAGPFINYVIEDKSNNRLLIAEGFAFAPSVSKRNHMFELEAIIRSIRIK